MTRFLIDFLKVKKFKNRERLRREGGGDELFYGGLENNAKTECQS